MGLKLERMSFCVIFTSLLISAAALCVALLTYSMYKKEISWGRELYKATVPDGEYVIEVKEFFNAATGSAGITEDVYWIEVQYYGKIQSKYLVFEYRFESKTETNNKTTIIMNPLRSLEVEIICGEKYVTVVGGRFVHIEYLPPEIPVQIRLVKDQSYEDLPTGLIPMNSDVPIYVYRIQSDVGADRVAIIPYERRRLWS